jgi:PD-(D/E)XK nuclease superfamily
MVQRPFFPPTVDSTILSTFRSCPQKFFRQYIEHWKSATESVHLIAGGAFAEGIEKARNHFYIEGGSAEDAEALGLQALMRRMCGALEFYFHHYPLGNDGAEPITLANGRRGIEFSFAEPLAVNHPVTGDPILYTGRSDMIAERAGGIYIYDEKTTSSLGASWGRQWEMRSQFTGYSWAARKQGIKTQGTIVRGVSILKTKYDTLEVPTYRSDYELERWERQAVKDIQRMIRCWKEGYWDYSLDNACNDYGGCAFTSICKESEPEAFLPIKFVKRVWDPLARKQLTVEEYEASWGFVGEAKPKLHDAKSDLDGQALADELAGMKWTGR